MNPVHDDGNNENRNKYNEPEPYGVANFERKTKQFGERYRSQDHAGRG